MDKKEEIENFEKETREMVKYLLCDEASKDPEIVESYLRTFLNMSREMAEQKNNWVKCSEPPKEKGHYLIIIYWDKKFHIPFTAQWLPEEKKWIDEDEDGFVEEEWSNRVTHWQPLPSKPNQE